MRVRLPQKVDDEINYFRQKVLPKTLFFRTMLLVIVPLIVVQIVSIVAYFDSSWGKIGKRLSDNLSENIAFIVALNEENPNHFDDLQRLAADLYGIEAEYSQNDEKYTMLNNAKKNKMVTGFFESSLRAKFTNAKTR